MNATPASPVTARVLRVVVALAIVAAVVATWLEAAGRTTVLPQNLLGYFTVQSNLILAAVYLVTTTARVSPRTGSLLRGCATTYIVIVGIVYATLLAPLGAAGGVPVAWANAVLHLVTPVYALVDWVAFRDREPLPGRLLWVVLVYPAGWLVVVLIRGATDGWVPYPFLDPATGYGAVTGYCVAILVVMVVFGGLVFWVSRRGVRRRPVPASSSR